VGELDDNFALLVERQPSDKERQRLYRVRDALRIKATDSVWSLLLVLEYYVTLYGEFPAKIATTAREVTNTVRAAAEADAKAAQEKTKLALTEAVRQAAVKAANDAATAGLVKWVSIAVGVVCTIVLIIGLSAYGHGRENGRAVGENVAKRECAALVAASSWANTPDGQLAYALAKSGGLAEVARCSGRGMVARDGVCTVLSERGKTMAHWPVPAVSTGSTGETHEE
jgi:hypothetical protein